MIKHISEKLQLPMRNVQNTIELLDEGCTIPFIARYRKERTGSLDEVKIATISEMAAKWREMEKRKETIRKTITEQGKMTEEIQAALDAAETITEVEDIYRPYKQKRKTRATVAIAKGLEPLADILLAQEKLFPHRKDQDIYPHVRRNLLARACVVHLGIWLRHSYDANQQTLHIARRRHCRCRVCDNHQRVLRRQRNLQRRGIGYTTDDKFQLRRK